MKSFLAICLGVVAVQALTDEQLVKLNRHNMKCLEESKADVDLVNKLKDGQFSGVNESLKQYTLCVMMNANLITADGVWKKDVALSKVFVEADKPVVDKIIDECNHLQGNTPQDKAWNYATCYHQKNKKYSIFQ